MQMSTKGMEEQINIQMNRWMEKQKLYKYKYAEGGGVGGRLENIIFMYDC